MSEVEVLDRIRELTPLLRERAVAAEEARRLPDESVKELKETGVVRLLQPKRFGGYEADPRLFYQSLLAVGAACGSSGWVTGVVGVHPWQIALFPDRVQHEVWDDDPDTWVSSSYMPGGRMTPAEGGYVLNGRWSFSSGCDHCQWAILGVMLDRGEGSPPEMWNVLIPRTDYRIEDVWHVMGLCGTGSNDIIVEDLFVPEHRTINLVKMFGWESPGLEVNTSPLYRMPFGTMFSNAITGAIIGMAEGILAENLAFTKARALTVPKGMAVRRRRIRSGRERLIGQLGVVRRWEEPRGKVLVDGALWQARRSWPDGEHDQPDLHAGDQIVVERLEGLTLAVRPAEDWELV